MANKSAVSYVISDEQDGFVAVDFDLFDGHDDEIRDWEIVDDCSSIAEKSDDDVDFTGSGLSDVASECSSDEITVQDLKSLPEYSPEMFASQRQSITGDGDVVEYVPGGEVEEEEDDNLCENGEDLHELFASEDSKPVADIIVGDRDLDSVESIQEMIIRERRLDYELPLIQPYREYDYEYDYERQEEEVDYDLDDELVPYSAKVKLGRERMRKLGKRSCSKLVKSKRLTYNYNKAGCLRGKHGLGLKHSLI